MITNRDCFFNKKSDFINRLPDISPNSVVYIADTQQIWTQNKYFECAMTPDRVEELILAHGYLVADDIPNLTGGAVATNGQYVSGVTVDGHQVNISKGNFSDINAGSASKLQIPRTISLTGDVSGSVSFDGSSNVSITSVVADNSHNHTISNISDLNSGWDSLLSNTPSAYITRWPSISEITDKQNLVIKLNGGTTEGTNQFTFNGVTSKSVNITPGTIGAQTAGNYMTTDTAQSITGAKTSVATPWAVRMNVDTSNEVEGLVWKNTAGSNIAGLTYHNIAKRIFINANYPEVTDIWSDTTGKYSLRIGWNELTYNNQPILRSDNYGSYVESIRTLYTGSGGVQPPNWIGTNKLKCAMMYSNPPGNAFDAGYCDWIIMNAYGWLDVPYSTAIGVLKTAGSPRAWIMSGNNSSKNSDWRRRELAYADQLPSFSYSNGTLTITT